jgi:hypothetical protein
MVEQKPLHLVAGFHIIMNGFQVSIGLMVILTDLLHGFLQCRQADDGAVQIHIPRENSCQKFDMRACARFRNKCRFATSHSESIYSTSKQTTENRLSCVYVHSTYLNHL